MHPQLATTSPNLYYYHTANTIYSPHYIPYTRSLARHEPFRRLNKSALSRPKVLSLRDFHQHARATITSLKRSVVTPPIDSLLVQTSRKEDDDGRNGDTRCQSGRKDIVVLGPEGEVSRSDVEPRESTGIDGTEHVGKVVWRPRDTSSPEHDGVEGSDKGRLGSALTGVVVDEG
jgi:hypothetical protein